MKQDGWGKLSNSTLAEFQIKTEILSFSIWLRNCNPDYIQKDLPLRAFMRFEATRLHKFKLQISIFFIFFILKPILSRKLFSNSLVTSFSTSLKMKLDIYQLILRAYEANDSYKILDCLEFLYRGYESSMISERVAFWKSIIRDYGNIQK